MKDIQMKIANSRQLNNEECKLVVRNLIKLMSTIVVEYGEDLVNQKMVKNDTNDRITNWAFDCRTVEMLNSRIDSYTVELKEYAVRRVYNVAYSSLVEYILSALEFGRKEPNKYNKEVDVHLFDMAYDVKMVDWQNGNPNYYCYRDYGQKKIWIAVDKKSSLSEIERVRNLVKYLKAYVVDNKELIESGAMKNIYVEGDKF